MRNHATASKNDSFDRESGNLVNPSPVTKKKKSKAKILKLKDFELKSGSGTIEKWRCSQCLSINDMINDICCGCKLDYSKDADDPYNAKILESTERKLTVPLVPRFSSFQIVKKSQR